MRSVVSCQAKSKPHATGTHAGARFVCWPASNETIVANLKRRRGAAVASSRCVGWRSSNPFGDFSEITAIASWISPKSTTADLGEIRNIPRRSRMRHQESNDAREKSGSYESLGLRGARPLVPGYSSGSVPSRWRPPIPEACYLGIAKNPHASILEMLEPFTFTFCGRAMF